MTRDSTAFATLVAWLGDRVLTFRSPRTASRPDAARCTSTLADDIAGNTIGLVLGTVFRFGTVVRFVADEAVVLRATGSTKEALANG